MFNNIGGKIKGLAASVTVIGIIASVIVGLVLMTADGDTVFLGILVAALGSFVSWLSSWLLYAFGQLVENSDTIVKLMRNEQVEPTSTSTEKSTSTEQPKNAQFDSIPADKILNGKCDMCMKHTEVAHVHIPTVPHDYTMCLNCIREYKARLD